MKYNLILLGLIFTCFSCIESKQSESTSALYVASESFINRYHEVHGFPLKRLNYGYNEKLNTWEIKDFKFGYKRFPEIDNAKISSISSMPVKVKNLYEITFNSFEPHGVTDFKKQIDIRDKLESLDYDGHISISRPLFENDSTCYIAIIDITKTSMLFKLTKKDGQWVPLLLNPNSNN